MSEINIELLKKIRDKIAATPEAYDQEVFARPESSAPCGTAACIAGWACVLSGEMDTNELMRRERDNGEEFTSIEITARKVLGLDIDDAETLFTENPEGARDEYFEDEVEGGWPEPFREQWWKDEHRPQIAVAYLDRIIETGKVTE